MNKLTIALIIMSLVGGLNYFFMSLVKLVKDIFFSDFHILDRYKLVGFKKLHNKAVLPKYAHPTDSGADLVSIKHYAIQPNEWVLVETGLAMQLPKGYEAQVRARSGMAAKRGLTVLNGIGTLDTNYRGPVLVVLINHSNELQHIEEGDKVAQLVISPVQQFVFYETEELDETDRGESGFGDSGR